MPASKFTKELFDSICERIANGESLRAICRDDKMPTFATVFNWMHEDETLFEQYTRARGISAFGDSDMLQDIAEKTLRGEIDPAAARAASDNIKWNAGRKNGKYFGDKLDVDHKGGIVVNIGSKDGDL